MTDEDMDMADDEGPNHLEGLCADLVCMDMGIPFVRRLVETYQLGEWASVADLCKDVELDLSTYAPVSSDLFVTWLDDPYASDGFISILFYDYDSARTLLAGYNRGVWLDGRDTGRLPHVEEE